MGRGWTVPLLMGSLLLSACAREDSMGAVGGGGDDGNDGAITEVGGTVAALDTGSDTSLADAGRDVAMGRDATRPDAAVSAVDGVVFGGRGGSTGGGGMSGRGGITGSGGMSGRGGSTGSGGLSDRDAGVGGPCDPFAPIIKSTILSQVLAVGEAQSGSIHVLDQDNGSLRLFRSRGSDLFRQQVLSSNVSSSPEGIRTFVVTATDDGRTPSFTVAAEVGGSGVIRMGVMSGAPEASTFVIGQQGEVLTILSATAVARMSVSDLPAPILAEYAASLPEGEILVVTRPELDWTFDDFRLYLGPRTGVVEREVTKFERLRDGGSTFITFEHDGSSAQAKFPVVSGDGGFSPGQWTLDIEGKSIPLTRLSAPPIASYWCLAAAP